MTRLARSRSPATRLKYGDLPVPPQVPKHQAEASGGTAPLTEPKRQAAASSGAASEPVKRPAEEQQPKTEKRRKEADPSSASEPSAPAEPAPTAYGGWGSPMEFRSGDLHYSDLGTYIDVTSDCTSVIVLWQRCSCYFSCSTPRPSPQWGGRTLKALALTDSQDGILFQSLPGLFTCKI
jgi:hypothetical protein